MTIHRLVPAFVLENCAADRRRGSFPAVGLFVDISGFSALTDVLMAHGQHGAEVLAGVMRAVMAPLIDTVFEQGGFVATQAGDAFTALFRVDALDQAPRRALAAAWKIQQHTARYLTHATPYGEFSISAKAGLALGETAWGIIPAHDGRRAAYYFQGTAVDRCAEAEHEARPGQIVLDPALYDVIRGWVTAEREREFYHVQTTEAEMPDPRPPAEAPVAEAPVDLAVASRFYPRELWLEPRSGEFRQVACLFVSLPNLRTEDQLDLFMQTAFALLDRYGGLLAGLDFGDKGAHFLIMWGAPIAHENDVERALGFILELQSQTTIPINGGITYRIAHAGFVGSDRAEQFAPYGRGVNLAARFMTQAPRGEIWLDAPAAERAQPRFSVEPIGERLFKGFAEPQQVYLLVERQETTAVAYSGDCVGRVADLEALRRFVDPIYAGTGAGALVVWGEPGIGKSRLVHEFLRQAIRQNPGILICLAQTDEILREPLNPFRYWLQSYVGITAAATEARHKRSFNRKIDDLIADLQPGQLVDELDRTRSFLGALVGLRWPDSLYERVDTQARYENTLIALATLLQAESRRQPVVLVIEDAHWLDDDSHAFLPRLLRSLTATDGAAYPVAILLTARFEGAGLPLADFPHADLFLEALDHSAIAAQAESLLGAPAGEVLLDQLEQRAEGNPFFAEQILRYLQDQGSMELAEGRWQVSPASPWPLPGDVNAVLVARLDCLPPDVREVVETAAVLGREFDAPLLGYMLRELERLPEKLKQAESLGIWSARNDRQYSFRHALLREAAYNMQVHTRRQALHARATGALAGLYAADLKPHYGELAYHAEQAGLDHQARQYLRLAGEAARESYHNTLALDYYCRALSLTPPHDLIERYALLSAREAVLSVQAKREEQQRDVEALVELARQLGDSTRQAEARLRLAELTQKRGDYIRAAQVAEEALSVALAAGAQEAAVGAYLWLAYALRPQGQFGAARRYGEAGLALARQIGYRQGEARMLNLIGWILVDQHELVPATERFEQSLAILREIGDQRGQATPLMQLGNVAGLRGDYAAAETYYDQALRIVQEIGERMGETVVLTNLSWIAGVQGDLRRARAYAEQNLRIAREIGDRGTEAYGLVNLSAHACGLCDYETAVNSSRRALELAREVHDRSAEGWALTNLGHSLAGRGELEAAQAAYQSALEIRAELEQPVLATEPCAGLARMELARGETGAALAQIGSILTHLQSGGTLDGTDEPMRVYLTCYLVLKANGDERARRVLQTAHQTLQSRADAISKAAAREGYLQNVQCNREIIQAWQEDQAGVGAG